MPTVFLSYRRIDTGGEAGRLADELRRKLGKRFTFRDVVSISPGDQFDKELEKQLANAQVVLVLIGPEWLQEFTKRLGNEEIDYLHLEVATSIKDGKRVIPVLLKGATLPPLEKLPEDIHMLVKFQAMTVRDEAWNEDVNRLINSIGRPYRWGFLIIRLLIAIAVIILLVWKLSSQFFPDQVSDYEFLRNLVFALIGIYGGIELFAGYVYFRKLRRLRKTV